MPSILTVDYDWELKNTSCHASYKSLQRSCCIYHLTGTLTKDTVTRTDMVGLYTKNVTVFVLAARLRLE